MIFNRAVSEKGGLLSDGPICGCPEVDCGRRRGCLTDHRAILVIRLGRRRKIDGVRT